jgi:hypothetical protein
VGNNSVTSQQLQDAIYSRPRLRPELAATHQQLLAGVNLEEPGGAMDLLLRGPAMLDEAALRENGLAAYAHTHRCKGSFNTTVSAHRACACSLR